MRLVVFLCGVLLCLCAVVSANAQDTVSMTCAEKSGEWLGKNASIYEGALCHTESGEGFYRLDFAAGKGAYAPMIPGSGDGIRYLFAGGSLMFYADDNAFYAVDKENFRLVWVRPWQKVEMLPADPSGKLFALITHDDGSPSLRLIQVHEREIQEIYTAQLESVPISFAWQDKRMIFIEPTRMSVWVRPEDDQTWTDPEIVEITPQLEGDDYQLDTSGLMVHNRENKRLSYFRFETSTWTRASINSTASIIALGAGPDYAMGVTSDLGTVRIVARMGSVLLNRYEAKYWKLQDPHKATIVIGQKDIAALDGGSDDRAQTIDTTEMTWKRLALIHYPAPGRIADLRDETLVSLHPMYQDVMILWNARTGKRQMALPQSALGGAEILSARIMPELVRFIFVELSDHKYVIFDRTTGKYTTPHEIGDFNSKSEYPQTLRIAGNYLIMRDSDQGQWTVLDGSPDAPFAPVQHSIKGFNPSTFDELQSPQEKWYGYCASPTECRIPTSHPVEQTKSMPDLVQPDTTPKAHRPSLITWILTLFAFLFSVGVMLWRRGLGKKSLINPPEDSDSGSTDIFDEKNRRFITDRDNRNFLAPSFVSWPAVRFLFSLLFGLVTAFGVAYRYFYDDSVSTFASWVIVLCIPVAAISWIAVSWNYWNRYYLFRYGYITEGRWLHGGEPNQSIAYTSMSGESYELGRHQWLRVDYVPMILYDPRRPSFATQFVGGSTHTIVPAGKIQDQCKPACTYGFRPFCIVLAVLAVPLIATQVLYKSAFPNTLSTGKLTSIAANLPPETTFTMECLKYCQTNDTGCIDQCHHRQIGLVLGQGKGTADDDPILTPQQFLETLLQKVSKSRSILSMQATCQEKEEQLADISLWPDDLSEAFWATYSDKETFDAAGLRDIYDGIVKDLSYLSALCDAQGDCARDASDCPVPPTCPGAVSALKTRVCAFQDAIKLPEM